MKFNKTEPEKYYEIIKKEKDFFKKHIEELFLIAKLTADKELKKEVSELLKKTADEDILKAFKNRSKFDAAEGWKARDKNLLLLLKLAGLSKNLNIGKMFSLLGDSDRVYLYDGLKLETIPQEIGRLDGITEMDIVFDSSKVKIPDSIGEIKSLKTLRIEGFGIDELPIGLTGLNNLEKLEIRLHNITEIPEWISKCQSLQDIGIGGYRKHIKYTSIPDFSELKNLKKLELVSMELNELPDTFFDLPQLETFEFVNIKGIKKFPSSISRMSGLKSLEIANCQDLQAVPLKITDLVFLESLKISSLSALEKIDGRILLMPGVKELLFYNCNAQIDMDEVGTSKIETLFIRDRSILEQLLKRSELFPFLQNLTITECKGLEEIPEKIGELKGLKNLRIEQNSIKSLPESMGGMELLEKISIRSGSLQSFPASISELKNLKELTITCSELDFSFNSVPQSLEILTVGANSIDLSVKKTLSVKNLTLSTGNISHSENINMLKGIKSLNITKCMGLEFKDISALTSLSELKLEGYPQGVGDDVAGLKNLEHLEIINFGTGKEIFVSSEIGGLPCLKILKIWEYQGENLFEILNNSNSIEELYLYKVSLLNQDSIFNEFTEILEKKNKLIALDLDNIEITNEMFEKLTNITQLESLRVNFSPLSRLSESLLKLKNLKYLCLRFLKLTELPQWIGEMKSLENLEVENMFDSYAFETLPASLADLPKLKRLSIYGIRPKEVPEELNRLELEELKIQFSRGWPVRKSVIDILKSKNTRLVGK